MRSSRVPAALLAFGVLALAMLGSTAWAKSTMFHGEVAGGDTVIHRFEHRGQRFEFRLLPTMNGWIIWIGDPVDRNRNFVAAVTPPFRGAVNPAVIQGWHFRNSDNTGPNEPGPKNVNAPQKRRDFAFVMNSDDFVRARQALDVLLWRGDRPREDVAAAEAAFANIPKARGVFRIEALELSNLVEGERAHIDRMAFSVTIDWPTDPD